MLDCSQRPKEPVDLQEGLTSPLSVFTMYVPMEGGFLWGAVVTGMSVELRVSGMLATFCLTVGAGYTGVLPL